MKSWINIHIFICTFYIFSLGSNAIANTKNSNSISQILLKEFGVKSEIYKRHFNQKKNIDSVLSEDEKIAIYAYTLDLYKVVNSSLRKDRDKKYSGYINLLKEALNKLPKAPGVVRRGTTLPPEVLSTYKKGGVISDKAFLSTTDKLFPKGKHHMTIKSLSGRDISQYSMNTDEGEILFLPNTQFKVLAVQNLENGETQIDLEEVP